MHNFHAEEHTQEPSSGGRGVFAAGLRSPSATHRTRRRATDRRRFGRQPRVYRYRSGRAPSRQIAYLAADRASCGSAFGTQNQIYSAGRSSGGGGEAEVGHRVVERVVGVAEHGHHRLEEEHQHEHGGRVERGEDEQLRALGGQLLGGQLLHVLLVRPATHREKALARPRLLKEPRR
uniref:Uncharacterized protein n=1 Tax=Steinernema glaseri TaxID=37863 RepID=A0A1I7ZK90_9BILA